MREGEGDRQRGAAESKTHKVVVGRGIRGSLREGEPKREGGGGGKREAGRKQSASRVWALALLSPPSEQQQQHLSGDRLAVESPTKSASRASLPQSA